MAAVVRIFLLHIPSVLVTELGTTVNPLPQKALPALSAGSNAT